MFFLSRNGRKGQLVGDVSRLNWSSSKRELSDKAMAHWKDEQNYVPGHGIDKFQATSVEVFVATVNASQTGRHALRPSTVEARVCSKEKEPPFLAAPFTRPPFRIFFFSLLFSSCYPYHRFLPLFHRGPPFYLRNLTRVIVGTIEHAIVSRFFELQLRWHYVSRCCSIPFSFFFRFTFLLRLAHAAIDISTSLRAMPLWTGFNDIVTDVRV